jgi:hypothetical protein
MKIQKNELIKFHFDLFRKFQLIFIWINFFSIW